MNGARKTRAVARAARRPVAKNRRPPGRSLPVAESEPSARERILEAALAAFASRGFDGVSVAEVAQAAGVTQPLVHYHFASKDELWRAAADRAFGDLRSTFATALDEVRGTDPAQAVRMLLRRFVLFSGRRREVAMILAREGFVPGARLDWLLERHLKPVQALAESVVSDGIARGKLKPLPFPNVMPIVIGAITGFFGSGAMIERLFGIDPLAPDEVNRHADVVEEVLLHGVLPLDRRIP